MNYKKHYDLLIETRRIRVIEKNVYYEKHHILPKSMGGDNSKNNLVKLTAREHYIAHLLLYKFSGDISMVRAFVMLSSRFKINNRMYEEARTIKNATMPKKEKHSCWGIKKPKMSEWMKSNSPMKNPETAAKVSAALKGRKLSKETKQKMMGRFVGSKNNNYKEIISTNLITGEVQILGLSATAKYLGVSRELINNRARNTRRTKNVNAAKKTLRKLTDWEIKYNDKA